MFIHPPTGARFIHHPHMRYANVTLIHSSEIVNMVGRLILFSLSWMKYRSFHQILREREELVGSWK